MVEDSLHTYLKTLGGSYYAKLPKRPFFPCSVVGMVVETDEDDYDGDSQEIETNFQVTVWAKSAKAAKEKARQIKTDWHGHVGDFNGTTVTNIRVSLGHEGVDTKQIRYSSIVEIIIYQ